MSAQEEIPAGSPTFLNFNPIARIPGSGTAVTAKQQFLLVNADTSNNIIELLGRNRIQYILCSEQNNNLNVVLKRGGDVRKRWPTTIMSPSRQGQFFPGFPVETFPGNVQFALEIARDNSSFTALTNILVQILFAAPL